MEDDKSKKTLTAPDQVMALVRRTNVKKPAPEDVSQLRKVLEEQPELWTIAGNMAKNARDSMIESVDATPLIKESVRRGMQEIERELGYTGAPMLEKLLIEQITICWLQMYITQHAYTIRLAQSVTLPQGDFWERRLSSVQGRYLRAMEALARVRRLARVTPLQVNIGGQQVNMIAPAALETSERHPLQDAAQS